MKKPSYAQSRNKVSFDWNEFLSRNPENIKRKEMIEALPLAGSWITCACGTQCKIIPRTMYGSPLDSELRLLGAAFNQFIHDAYISRIYGDGTRIREHFKKARKILKKIEKRSGQLMRQIAARKAVATRRRNAKLIDKH